MSDKNFPTFKEWMRWDDMDETNDEIVALVGDSFTYQRYELAKAVHAMKATLPPWFNRYTLVGSYLLILLIVTILESL